MEARRKKVIYFLAALVAAGLVYAALYTLNILIIPCLFYEITGFLCPGCGISRMCLALLRLDFYAAYSCNRAVFFALPVFFVLAVQMIVCYIKRGSLALNKVQNAVVWFLLLYFLAFGLLRNLR